MSTFPFPPPPEREPLLNGLPMAPVGSPEWFRQWVEKFNNPTNPYRRPSPEFMRWFEHLPPYLRDHAPLVPQNGGIVFPNVSDFDDFMTGQDADGLWGKFGWGRPQNGEMGRVNQGQIIWAGSNGLGLEPGHPGGIILTTGSSAQRYNYNIIQPAIRAHRESTYYGSVTTTNATATTLRTFLVDADRTYHVEARVYARRTGGAAGTANDGASYIIRGTYTTKAGVLTAMGTTPVAEYTQEDQAGWNATLAIGAYASGGADNCVAVRVTGAADNTVDWECKVSVFETLNAYTAPTGFDIAEAWTLRWVFRLWEAAGAQTQTVRVGLSQGPITTNAQPLGLFLECAGNVPDTNFYYVYNPGTAARTSSGVGVDAAWFTFIMAHASGSNDIACTLNGANAGTLTMNNGSLDKDSQSIMVPFFWIDNEQAAAEYWLNPSYFGFEITGLGRDTNA